MLLCLLNGGSCIRYDREEGNTMFDADSSSFFLGDDPTSYGRYTRKVIHKYENV